MNSESFISHLEGIYMALLRGCHICYFLINGHPIGKGTVYVNFRKPPHEFRAKFDILKLIYIHVTLKCLLLMWHKTVKVFMFIFVLLTFVSA